MNRAPHRRESAVGAFVVLVLSVAVVAAVFLGAVAYALYAPASSSPFPRGCCGPPVAGPTSILPCPPGKTPEPALGVTALIPVYGLRPDGTVCTPAALLTGGG